MVDGTLSLPPILDKNDFLEMKNSGLKLLASYYTEIKPPMGTDSARSYYVQTEAGPDSAMCEQLAGKEADGRIVVMHNPVHFYQDFFENPNLRYVPGDGNWSDGDPLMPVAYDKFKNPIFPERYSGTVPGSDVDKHSDFDKQRFRLQHGTLQMRVDEPDSPEGEWTNIPQDSTYMSEAAKAALTGYLAKKSALQSENGFKSSFYYYAKLDAYWPLYNNITQESLTIDLSQALEGVGKGNLQTAMVACILYGWFRNATNVDIQKGTVTFASVLEAQQALDMVFRRPGAAGEKPLDPLSNSLSFFVHGLETEENWGDDFFTTTAWAWKTYDALTQNTSEEEASVGDFITKAQAAGAALGRIPEGDERYHALIFPILSETRNGEVVTELYQEFGYYRREGVQFVADNFQLPPGKRLATPEEVAKFYTESSSHNLDVPKITEDGPQVTNEFGYPEGSITVLSDQYMIRVGETAAGSAFAAAYIQAFYQPASHEQIFGSLQDRSKSGWLDVGPLSYEEAYHISKFCKAMRRIDEKPGWYVVDIDLQKFADEAKDLRSQIAKMADDDKYSLSGVEFNKQQLEELATVFENTSKGKLESLEEWWELHGPYLVDQLTSPGVWIGAAGLIISASMGLASLAVSIAIMRTIRKQSAPLNLDQKKEIFDKATSDFRTEWRQGYDASAPKVYPDFQGVRDFDPRVPGASADSLFPGFDPSQPVPHVNWGIARTAELKKFADTILIQSGNLNTANPASMLLEAIGGQGKDWIMIGLVQSVETGVWPDGSALEGDYTKLMDREKFPILKFKPKALMEGGGIATVQSTTIQAFIDQYAELLRQGKFPLLYWVELYRTWREGEINQANLRAEGIGSALIDAMGDGRMMLVGTGAPADRDKVTADLQSTKGGQAVQVFGRLAKVYGETGLPEMDHAESAAGVYMVLARFCHSEGIEYDHNALLATAKELVEATKTELPGMGLARATRQLTDEFKTFLKESNRQEGFCVNFDTYASSKKNKPSPGVAAQIQRIREATSTLAEREYTTEELRVEVADLQRRGILAGDFKLDTAIGEFLNGLGIRTDAGGNATERPAQQLSRTKVLAAYLERLVQVTESVLPGESQKEIRRTLIAIYMHGTDALNLSPQGQIDLAVDLQTMQLRRRGANGGSSGGSSGSGAPPPPRSSPPPAPRSSAPPGSSTSATSATTFVPKLTLTELIQLFPQLRQPFENPEIAERAILVQLNDAQKIMWRTICPEGVQPKSCYEIALRLQKLAERNGQDASIVFARMVSLCSSTKISSPALGVFLMKASGVDARSGSDPQRVVLETEMIVSRYEKLVEEKRSEGRNVEEEARRAEAWRRELERQKQERERAVAVPL